MTQIYNDPKLMASFLVRLETAKRSSSYLEDPRIALEKSNHDKALELAEPEPGTRKPFPPNF